MRPLASGARGALPLVGGVCWGVTAGKSSHNASNARDVTAGKMGRNSSSDNHRLVLSWRSWQVPLIAHFAGSYEGRS